MGSSDSKASVPEPVTPKEVNATSLLKASCIVQDKSLKEAQNKEQISLRELQTQQTEKLDGLDIEIWEKALKQLKMILEKPKEVEVPKSKSVDRIDRSQCKKFQKKLQDELQHLADEHCCTDCVVKVVVR